MQRLIPQDQSETKAVVYRSKVDSGLTISNEQAVITVATHLTPPHKAKLYIEKISEFNNGYTIHRIGHHSVQECGDIKESRSSELDVYGHGIIDCILESTEHDLFVGDYYCFSKVVPAYMTNVILKLVQEYKNNFGLADQNSLAFFKNLLSSVGVLDNENEFRLVPVSIKPFSNTLLREWRKFVGEEQNLFHVHPVDIEAESKFSAMMLPLKVNQAPLRSPESRLHHFFKNHINKTHVIDWKSDEGQKIRFLSEYFGLMTFSYNTVLKYQLDNQILKTFPIAIIDIIVNYGKEHASKFAFESHPPKSKSACSIM